MIQSARGILTLTGGGSVLRYSSADISILEGFLGLVILWQSFRQRSMVISEP